MLKLPEISDSTLVVADRVAVLTLNRDDVRNALTGTTLVDDIVNTVAWINSCSEVSVLIITGSGSAFSAGGNIKEMQAREGIFAGSPLEIEQKLSSGHPAHDAGHGSGRGAGYRCGQRSGDRRRI